MPDFHEYVLEQVIGVFMTAHEMPDMPVQPFAVRCYDPVESLVLLPIIE